MLQAVLPEEMVVSASSAAATAASAVDAVDQELRRE
jgi:hypothetical protein